MPVQGLLSVHLSRQLVDAEEMTMERVVAVVSSLSRGRWLSSEEAALEELQLLGFGSVAETVTELSSGVRQRAVEPVSGTEHASLSSLHDEPTSIIFFVASAPEPASASTTAAYEELVAGLSEELGSPERVWAEQPSPLQWHAGELDVGVQLFDRRDTSVVMVWVEHRARSQTAKNSVR